MGWGGAQATYFARDVLITSPPPAKTAYIGKAPQACVMPSSSESSYAVLIYMHFPTNVDGIQGVHQRDTKYVVGNEVHGTN